MVSLSVADAGGRGFEDFFHSVVFVFRPHLAHKGVLVPLRGVVVLVVLSFWSSGDFLRVSVLPLDGDATEEGW